MQIILDARNTGRAMGTGVTTYTKTLAEALKDQKSISVGWLHETSGSRTTAATHSLSARSLRFARALSSRRRKAFTGTGQQTGNLISEDVFRIGHVHFNIYEKLLAVEPTEEPSVMHWTCPLPLYMPGCPNIVTIHDLIPVLHPEFCQTDPGRIQRLLESVIDRADLIVTISETVKKDLMTHFGLPPEHVRVIHQATNIHSELLHTGSTGQNRCPDDSFIHIGTIERRKNIGRLIRAHSLSRTRRMLVLIGPDGFGAEQELAALSDHLHPERVMRLPWIDRADLLATLGRARAVVFPSLAEGFGLPIVEAMALGIPVLTSRGSTTEEIAGGAACLVDPLDIGSITAGLIQLDRDETLCQSLAALGSKHVKHFSPHDYGARFSALYRDVVAARPPSSRHNATA
ncbi:glycosyltransferase [Gluconobacter thailandicus]|uniref:glycosyltransferase family 4 protein n=1 Tax=Gluconobacter thailandicus TaxID=257438 RepID=UPI0007780C37|nr:glycosyltransferase family 1 protein [Gluconobacter thailandicus]KXV32253.1 glycosyltransferase [Gluconobacter thailandicus]